MAGNDRRKQMANQEHLELLKQSLQDWNRWRAKHPEVQPDLSEANLGNANLGNADLSRADLNNANLSGADLSNANLSRADLSRATLVGTNLPEPILTETHI